MADDSTTWWAPVPRSLRDDPLITTADIAVFCALSWRMNWNSRRCWPSLATIAADAKMSKASVARSLNRLEDLGYVSRNRRKSAGGDYTSTEYRIEVTPDM